MVHPEIDNLTPYAFEPAFLTDQENWPVFVPILKATFEIGLDGRLKLGDEQLAVNFAGERNGLADESSYRYEPEGAYFKPGCDCVLLGHAQPPSASSGEGGNETVVGFRIGALRKVARVFGDRFWVKSLGGLIKTMPRPIEVPIALQYENAFGGWDRQHADLAQHSFEQRNPAGTGYRRMWSGREEAVRLPNIEDPQALISRFDDRPAPMGFGFISPNWQPRTGFAGTYDAAWRASRMPKLPNDFDPRYFNAASVGLVWASALQGNERVSVVGASTRGALDFELPGMTAPVVDVSLRGNRNQSLETRLDTVIVDADHHRVVLIWRAHLRIKDVPHDIAGIRVRGTIGMAA